MAERKTIYLPDHVAAFFADARHGLSGRIAAVVDRYARICHDHLPELTRSQWCAICDANNGLDDMGDSSHGSWWFMWANVADSQGLGDKWKIDQDELIATMRAWSTAQTIAAYEAVRTFWVHHEKETDEALALAGMIKPERASPRKREGS